MEPRSRPVVSIGLPVFNGAEYLEEAIASLLGQTFDQLELIIADNASTDRTEEICRRAVETDPRVSYFRHPENLGAGPNYTFALEQSRGDFFMWAAHDDIRHVTFLERALAEFEKVPGAASVFGVTERIDEDGNSIGILPRPPLLISDRPERRFRAAITCRFPDIVVFGLMRRSLLDATGGHGNFPGADRVLAAELALLGPFIEVPDTLFYNRHHPSRYVRIGRTLGRNAKSLWWDTSRHNTVDAPAFKRLLSYARAIQASGLPATERAKCLGALGMASLDNRAGIAREVIGDLIRAGFSQAKRVISGGDEDKNEERFEDAI